MKLPENLKRIRKENNLSQEQLAEKLGVSRQAVSKWESGQSYPEMDKVLTICKLFNYNIDELMNENVKEVSENKQSKINFNKYVDDFFGFITKTMAMFESMKFGQKVKCIFEQFMIGVCIAIVLAIIAEIGSMITSGVFGWLPNRVYFIIRDIFSSIYLIFSIVIGAVILLHIFKIRYLDYYELVKDKDRNERKLNSDSEDKSNNEQESNEKYFENKKEKIIIRDPEHSESRFLNGIAKIIIFGVKAFVGFCACIFVFSLVMLCASLICSFLFVKTGLLFVGAIICILAAIVINIVILEILYNFIISKKNAKLRIGVTILISLIVIGIGGGLSFIGITSFNVIEEGLEDELVKDVYNYNIEDIATIENSSWGYIEYIESDNSDVRIEVAHYDNFDTFTSLNGDKRLYIYCTSSEGNIFKELRRSIKDINNKEIRDYSYFKISIYATKENIQKLENNARNLDIIEQDYEERIEELEDEVDEKDEKIFELENKLEEYMYN